MLELFARILRWTDIQMRRLNYIILKPKERQKSRKLNHKTHENLKTSYIKQMNRKTNYYLGTILLDVPRITEMRRKHF